MRWVLQHGKRSWFRSMGQIGPRMTGSLYYATRFETKREAMNSDAYFFCTALRPVRYSDARKAQGESK